jgi:hypothetical protein
MKYQTDYGYKDNSPLKYLTDNYGLSIKLCEKDDGVENTKEMLMAQNGQFFACLTDFDAFRSGVVRNITNAPKRAEIVILLVESLPFSISTFNSKC